MAATDMPSMNIVHEVLNQDNYEFWSIRVKTYLLAKGLWSVVKPTIEDGEVDLEKNAQALHAIHICCGDDMFPFVSDKDTAKAAWDSLEAKFKSTPVNNGSTCGDVEESVPVMPENTLPLLSACFAGKWDLARHHYHQTPLEDLTTEQNSRVGAQFISLSFYSQVFDIAFDLIRRRPMLTLATDNNGNSPLYVLSTVRAAFLTGTRLNLWQKLIYHGIRIPSMENLVCLTEERIEDGQGNQENFRIRSVMDCFGGLINVLGINDIRKKKLVHVRTLEMLDIMCEATKYLNLEQLNEGVMQQAILQAVEQGNVECVRKMCEANRMLLGISDGKGKSLFQFSIECRQEKVYCYLFESATDINIDRKLFESGVDKFGNSILHSAASLSSIAVAQLNHIQGAALQLQSELQWFKEVESIVPLRIRNMVNEQDHMTARELFTKNHKEMVKEGEKQMKEIATSCTVVGALIVTMMFAAAFTVPGGTNGDTGMPIFLNKKWFRVFIFSDAISLLSSTTSIVIFLGILTSRYEENDFLKSLPKKMVFGLSTLFISIAAMMIAFVSALIIMLLGTPWIIITVVSLASIPVTSFAWMQFPLLFEILISTFRRGRFQES